MGRATRQAATYDTLIYDAENRQTSFSGNNATYEYDGEGRRVALKQGGNTTVFVYDVAGQLAAKYFSGTAGSSPCSTCYISTDHLGSTRMITDAAGNVVSKHDHLPFGEELIAGHGRPITVAGVASPWNTSDPIRQKFTGKERDQESGLDYFGTRYYGSALGRFTSPDPIFFQKDMIADPQRWNLYAYVRNNPLALVDPKGEAIELLGDEKEREKSLRALRNAVGTKAGKMIMTVFAGIAEFERDLIRERTGAGRENAKKRGVRFGRPRKLNPDQVRVASKLLTEGKAVREIARTFNVHEATIYRLADAHS